MADLAVSAAGILSLAAVAAGSWRIRATDVGGSVSGFLMGVAIGLAAGWSWVVFLMAFLVLGTVATRYKYAAKTKIHAAQEKGGARGVTNVVANGGVAAALAVLYLLHTDPLVAGMFVAAVASPAADTMATEIGVLSRSRPRLITDMSFTQAGTSGGITALGTVVALLTCVLFAALGVVLHISGYRYAAAGLVGGFVGCNLDSLFGATLQGTYRCGVCGERTEKGTHCSREAQKVRGYGFIGNSEVNLLSGIGAAVLALALELVFL